MFSATSLTLKSLNAGRLMKPIKQTHTWRMGRKKRDSAIKETEDFLRKYNTCLSKKLPKPRNWTEEDVPVPLYKQDHVKLLEKYGYGNTIYKTLQKYE
ncbi:hypothetical protein CYY_005281 [Polysphondylium violaceum]|uniref:Uncharacterized protein n=1 Tax=Polysphondylium violaceum TaxID=133409 RepID=A0A8J4PTR9_9MYCE|nr:hypothetical protein CYY_005281 [Polysphondylium violaceum]